MGVRKCVVSFYEHEYFLRVCFYLIIIFYFIKKKTPEGPGPYLYAKSKTEKGKEERVASPSVNRT